MARCRTFAELTAAFEARRNALVPAMERAVEQHTQIVYNRSIENMRELIYGTPPDTRGYSWRYRVRRTTGGKTRTLWTFKPRKSDEVVRKQKWQASDAEAELARKQGTQHGRESGRGRAEWVQTGNLRRSERMTVEYARLTGVIVNKAPYALPRHDLGLSSGDADAYYGSKRKSRRIAPWRKRAVQSFEPMRLAHYRDAVHEVLQKG
jgi:hypothetical protein